MSTERNTFIHLHTLDLRLHDSPSLHVAHSPSSSRSKSISHFLPVYIFDERQLDLSHLQNSHVPSNRTRAPQARQQDLPDNPNHQPRHTKAAPRSRVANFHRTSPHRLLFLLEAVFGLRESYRRSGGDLLIGYGRPETLLPELVSSVPNVEGVWAQDEVTVEEKNMLNRLDNALHEKGSTLHLNDSKTLLPTKHLPFDPKNTPDIYTSFRKNCEGLGLNLGGGMLVEALQTARDDGQGPRVSVGKDGISLKPYPTFDIPRPSFGGWLPDATLDDLYSKLAQPLLDSSPIAGWSSAASGSRPPKLHSHSAVPFAGDERAGLHRLEDYVGHQKSGGWFDGEKAKSYKATRNGMIGEAFSTKFSAWLSLGSLSARSAGWRVGQLLEEVGRDKGLRDNVYCERCEP